MAEPYHDKETLVELYSEEGLTAAEVGEKLGCTGETIRTWLHEHSIPVRSNSGYLDGMPWHDDEILARLHFGEGMSTREIGDKLGCSGETVRHRLNESEYGTASQFRYHRSLPPYFGTDANGYEVSEVKSTEERDTVKIHRLVMVAEAGLDAVADKVVHHVNGIPWDNRPGNLKLMTASEHARHHNPPKGDSNV